ncbi:MAG TPA: DPP IV N-terminal domain-containing protein, partial [Tepidisphaeraceae bacterium]|nr:DPP IV N-terminal domain-containing protein [Tepidisphaeraceae bacterium]
MNLMANRLWLGYCRVSWLALLCLLPSVVLGQSDSRVYRDRVDPHWFANNTRFWYRNNLRDGAREFILVDAEKGTRQPAFDHARLAAALTAAGQPATADKLPIETLQFDDAAPIVLLRGRDRAWRLDLQTYELQKHQPSPDSSTSLPASSQPRPSRRTGDETQITFVNRTAAEVRIHWIDTDGQRHSYAALKPGDQWDQHTFAGHVWLATDPTGKPLAVFEAADEWSTAIIDGKPKPASADRPARRPGPARAESPDGKWIAFIKDHNLHIREKDTAAESALSTDGTPDDSYSLNNIWWSPDSQYLAALRVEKAQEHKIHIVESSPSDQLQPKLRTIDYLKPGDRIAHPRPQLFHLPSRR